MAAVDDIRSRLDLDQIAGMLGTDVGTADAAVQQALSQLVGTMGGNASDPEAAAGLTRAALKDHLSSPAYGDRIDATAVDTEDGAKIVDHLMPAAQQQTLDGAGEMSGLLQKLLPILAPIVMAYLANQMSGRLPGQAGGQASQAGAGGGLGDVLGGLLGGSGASGGGLGDLLGGLLGGSAQAPQQVPQTQSPLSSTDGPFRTPPVGEPRQRADDSVRSDPTPGSQGQQPPGGGLGGLLKDILLGGGR